MAKVKAKKAAAPKAAPKPAPSKPKEVMVRLLKHYRPVGDYTIVMGFRMPGVLKIEAGSVVKLPYAEAAGLVSNNLAVEV